MYRLLIVDDEEIIVNGLYEIFSSLKDLPLDVYKAYSGKEALEWLSRCRIDLVVSDIQMPEMDGLELLELIRSRWSWCRVIFLTGHSNFDYLYKAVQEPHVSYVLKSEGHEKVIKAVEAAVVSLKEELRQGDLKRSMDESMGRLTVALQKDFLVRLMKGRESLSPDGGLFEKLSIPLSPGLPVLMAAGSAEAFLETEDYWERNERLFAMKQLTEGYMSLRCKFVSFFDENYRLILLMQPAKPDPKPPEDWLKLVVLVNGTLELVQSACKENLKLSVSFVIAGNHCSFETMAEMYRELAARLNFCLEEGIETVTGERGSGHTAELEKAGVKWSAHLLIRYLELGKQELVSEVLNGLFVPLKKVKSMNSPVALEAYYRVVLPVLSYINSYGLMEKLAFRYGMHRLTKADSFESWELACGYVEGLVKILLEIRQEDQALARNDTISVILDFISRHLGEDLSLVRLSEEVNFNPSYLSRFFKLSTGMNLSDYIENERMERAKEFLCDPRRKVNEAGQMVGYENAASFTRVFRKKVGLSPVEYKEMQRK